MLTKQQLTLSRVSETSMNKSAAVYVEIEPNTLTKKTLNKSVKGEDVQTFGSLDQMFKSWEE